MQQVRDFCFFFVVQFFYYGLIAWNYRAVAQAHYLAIIMTDATLSIVSFTVIKEIAKKEAGSRAGMIGYACGGAAGACLSVFLSRRFFGQ